MRFFQRIADRTAWHTVFSPPDEWNLHSTGIPSTRRHCGADERTRIRVPMVVGVNNNKKKEVREIRSEFQISLMIYYTLYKRILRVYRDVTLPELRGMDHATGSRSG